MLTSKDIRLAYAAIHGVTSITEFEKYDLMNASQYPAKWLELPIAEFMVVAGFADEVEKSDPSNNKLDSTVANVATVNQPTLLDVYEEALSLSSIVNAEMVVTKNDELHPNLSAKRVKIQVEAKPKRKYTKKAK